MLMPAEVKELSRIRTSRTVLVLFFDWALIAALFIVAARFPHPLTWLVCAVLMARQQLSLAILMHEAAHKRLLSRPYWNDLVGQLFAAGPILFSVNAYRGAHMVHHRAPLAPTDPDIRLIGVFPISKMSLVRKLTRDLLGITYFKLLMFYVQSASRLRDKRKGADSAPPGEAMGTRMVLVSMALSYTLIFVVLWLSGHPLLFLLWAIPPMTILQFLLRIAGIAEHGGCERSDDQALATRTVINPLQTFFFAPHNVNYHIEHHVYPSVPFFNLPRLHRLMKAQGALPSQNVCTSYLTMLKQLVT